MGEEVKNIKSPCEKVDELLQTEWELSDKKRKARVEHLKQSNDNFPMHIILVDTENIKTGFKTEIHPICHVKVCKVVEKPSMSFITQFIVAPITRRQGFG